MFEKIKGVLFTDEPKDGKGEPARQKMPLDGTPEEVAAFARSVREPAGFLAGGSPVPTAPLADDGLLTRLREASHLSKTPAGGVLKRYLDALAETPMDGATRLQLAIVQARKLDGLTPEGILSSCDMMATLLHAEQEGFGKAQAQAKAKADESDARLKQIQAEVDAKRAEISKLMEEQARVQSEGWQISQHVQQVQAQFNQAVAQRSAEIAQERDRVVAALRG